MELSKDGNTVHIDADAFGHKIDITLSILQLAKIFGTDGEVAGEYLKSGFGSVELEDKCNETREFVKAFPNITVWDNKVEFRDISISEGDTEETLKIFGEDISGWSNEGIMIIFPKKLYNKTLENKKFRIFVAPFFVDLRTNEERQ